MRSSWLNMVVVADFAAVILLSLFFSGEAAGMGSTLLLLGGFLVLVAAVGAMLAGFGRVGQLRSALQKLRDSSAQIRVRGAFVLLVGFVVLAHPIRSAVKSGNPPDGSPVGVR